MPFFSTPMRLPARGAGSVRLQPAVPPHHEGGGHADVGRREGDAGLPLVRDLHGGHDHVVAMREQPVDHAVPILGDKGAGEVQASAQVVSEIDLEPREMVAVEVVVRRAGAFAGDDQVGGFRLRDIGRHSTECDPENRQQLQGQWSRRAKPRRQPGKNQHKSPVTDKTVAARAALPGGHCPKPRRARNPPCGEAGQVQEVRRW